MATVYVKSVEASSWSRTTWDDTGATNYVAGDRVMKVIADGTAYENLAKTYVCIVDNNSTTDPETDTANWARVGFSEEYPFHAPGGSIETTTTVGEVFLDGENQRYKGLSTSERSFYHHAQNFGADSEGTIIFLDGTYTTTSPIPGDKINYVAKNQGKVTFNLNTSVMSAVVFGWNYDYHNRHEGINYQVGGTVGLFQHNSMLSSFKNCVFTDEDSIHGNYTSASNSLGYANWVEFENCVLNLPNSTCHIAGHNLVLGPNGRDALWKNSTFIMQLGNVSEHEPLFFQTNANSPITLEKCVFYIPGHVYSDAHNLMAATVKATDCVAFSADNSLPEITSSNSGLTIRNPLFIDPSNGDFRLRPSSPLIGGQTDSLTLLEAQYPNSVWYDSSATSGGDGSKESPFDVLLSAIQASSTHTVLIKNGTHTLGQQIIDTGGSPVTLVGESTDAILFFQGGSGYGYINTSQGGNSDLLTLKNLSFRYNGGSVYGIFNTKDLTASECKFSMTDNALSAGADNRGWFTGVKGAPADTLRLSRCEISGNAINGVSGASLISGGDYNQSCFSYIYICDCTIVSEGSYTNDFYFNFSPTEFELKNTIHVGFDGTEALGKNPTVGSGNIYFNTNITPVLPKDSSSIDPNFVGSGDYRLRPSSAAIGGIKAEDSSAYYLQPGNAYNGDGSQKDASAMTTDGDPGPFNSLSNVRAANVPFNSKVTIINGTYSWPSELSPVYANLPNGGPSTGYEGYNYVAETPKGVVFDAGGQAKFIVCNPKLNSAFADLDTTFNGVVFKDSWTGFYHNNTRSAISTWTDTKGQGSLTFDRCSFENWIVTSSNASFIGNQTYGEYGIDLTFSSCSISIAFDGGGGLFGNYGYGGNTLEGDHVFKNNTIVIKGVGSSSVGGRNANPSGTGYAAPAYIFSTADNTQKIVEGNIFYIEYNSSKTGNFAGLANNASKFPQLKNNLFYDVNFGASESVVSSNNLLDIDPSFVDASADNFSLRPNSPLIGQG